MKLHVRISFILTFILTAILACPLCVLAQDDPEAGSGDEVVDEEVFELTDEELDALLTRVDRFFIDQGMAQLTVDLDLYRDPSNLLNEQNIRQGDPSRIAGLSTLVSHYTYEWPGYYLLTIMGEQLAGSDLPEDATFFSQVLPLPGAPIYTEDIRERFYIRFMRLDELDGVPVYKIRYTAYDLENEFFNWLIYYIDVEREVILRVETTFDNYWYEGTGEGNFYYDDFLDRYLPIYGHGSILFFPNRRFNLWGRWYRWNWLSPEEVALAEAGVEEIANEEVTSASGEE